MTGTLDGPAAPTAEDGPRESPPEEGTAPRGTAPQGTAPRGRGRQATARWATARWSTAWRALPSWDPAAVRRRLPEAASVAAPAVLLGVLAWSHRWIADDGLIAARTVRQILAGHGPVFNRGERVEANTSALWTWLNAAEAWITGLNVYTVLMWTGLILAPLGLVFAQLGTLRLLRARGGSAARRRTVPFGAVVVAVLPPFWDFTTSGLETSLVLFWLGFSWWLLTAPPETALARRAAILGLGWVVRPDMAIASAVFLVVLLANGRPGPRRAIGVAVAALAVPLGYEIFRMGYYGLIVPNTALTKEATSSNLSQGLTYLGNYTGPYALWIPAIASVAAVLALQPWRGLATPGRLVLASGAVSGLLLGGYVVYIGGDFMHGRMLLPATFALALPVMSVPLPRRPDGPGVAAGLALAATGTWALVCAFSLRVEQKPYDIPANGIVNERVYWVQRTHDAHPDAGAFIAMVGGSSDPAEALRQHAGTLYTAGQPMFYVADGRNDIVAAAPLDRPGVPVAMSGELLGALGVMVPLDGLAVDDHGLSYAVGSHLEADGLRIGHQKTTGATWMLADYTGVQTDDLDGAGPVDLARTDLSCGRFGALLRATRGPLGTGEFLANIWHAYGLSAFRVPNDPSYAHDELCG